MIGLDSTSNREGDHKLFHLTYFEHKLAFLWLCTCWCLYFCMHSGAQYIYMLGGWSDNRKSKKCVRNFPQKHEIHVSTSSCFGPMLLKLALLTSPHWSDSKIGKFWRCLEKVRTSGVLFVPDMFDLHTSVLASASSKGFGTCEFWNGKYWHPRFPEKSPSTLRLLMCALNLI